MFKNNILRYLFIIPIEFDINVKKIMFFCFLPKLLFCLNISNLLT